jgi:hypothetical protein
VGDVIISTSQNVDYNVTGELAIVKEERVPEFSRSLPQFSPHRPKNRVPICCKLSK